MSFRGDDQRYGHVPPVQYPVANQPHQQYQQHQQQQQQQHIPPPPAQSQYSQSPYPARRPSFNSGDDNSYFDQGHSTQYQGQPHHQIPPAPSQNHGPPVLPPVFSPSTTQRFDDELFLSPTEGRAFAPPPIPKKPVAYGGGPVTVGNSPQPQYQAQPSPSTYNPQVFGRSQSQSLPYRPAPAARLASPILPSIASFQAQQQQHQQPHNYTPAAYNPAAYVPADPGQPQRSSTLAYAGYPHSYSAPVVPQQHTVYPPTPVVAQQSPVPSAQSPQRLYQPPTPQSQQQAYQPSSYYAAAPPTTGASPQLPVHQDSHLVSAYTDGTYSAPPQTAAVPAPPSQTPSLPPPTTTSQAPYPTYTHTAATTSYVPAAGPNTFASRAERSNSATSQPLSNRSVSPSAGLRRHPTNAPLPSRPPVHDAPLQDPGWLPSDMAADDHLTQESLIHDIEADLGISNNYPSASDADSAHQVPLIPNNGLSPSADVSRHGSLASATSPGWSSATSGIDRTPSTATTASGFDYEARAHGTAPSPYRPEEDSDPEAALGLWEMQQADLREQRLSHSGPSVAPGTTMGAATTPSPYAYTAQQGRVSPGLRTAAPLSPASEDPNASDSEFVGMDIGLVSGGYAGTVSYGNDVGTTPLSTTPRPYEGGIGGGNQSQQYAPFLDAEMDYGGTGGLQPPVVHRLSFDDGDEQVSLHSGRSGSDSPTKDDFLPDMFYHPGLSSRPLPALPPGPTRSGSNNSNMLSAAPSITSRASYQHGYSLSSDSRTSTYYSQHEQQSQIHVQNQSPLQLPVERSTSMSSPSTTPIVHVPGRSRTDAAEERRKIQRQALASQNGGSSPYGSSYDGSSTVAAPFDGITLPGGRRKRFIPSKLTSADFDRCTMPWALSDLAHWVRDMAEGEQDLKRKTIEEGLVVLFIAKVPNMNVADAETLAAMVADSMFAAGILLPDEEWVKFGPGSMSGVLWQLTGSGCYAPRVHDPVSSGRCYSYHCTRTLRKANLNEILAEESAKKEDWVKFYNITKEMMESKPHKEIERQNNLHEIVTGEEEFNGQLDVLRVLYRDQLLHWHPPIIPPKRLAAFVETVFGKVESLQQVNRDHLLAQLKYCQNVQGPWITGFSGIFREWIRKAKDHYLAYSKSYPVVSYQVRTEAIHNREFRQFLEHVRNHPRCNRLGWDTFLKAPITRLQRYSLLLATVYKNTVQDSEEKVNLAKAIEEIRAVTKECDRLVDEMGKKVQLQGLQNQLVFRQASKTKLNLDHLGRELLMEGDLLRMGSKGVRWVDTHAFLFDHYFILAKAGSSGSSLTSSLSSGSKEGRDDKKYDVSKEPIPMPLLLLESMNDEPVAKQKGLAAPLGRTTAASASDIRLNKVMSNGSGSSGRPELDQSSTGGSSGSLSTRLTAGSSGMGGGGGGGGGEEGKILYPFRVKHLGHEIYTLYASTPQIRSDWCQKIIEAKTRHARALLQQNAEPFRLRVLADGAFAYDSATAMTKQPVVPIQGTPLDRSIREMEQVFGTGRGPLPVCRASVNCATGFHSYGKSIIAIGTDFGVYISDATNPRGWTKTVQMQKVTQIAVLEAFSVCLVLADKALISYPLDVVAPVSNYPVPAHDSVRRAPQRLAKDVSFFATARMKGRTLLFYKRKEGLHNTFRVLEPVFQKASEKKARFFSSSRGKGAGTTELFRDFDEFYLPTECYSLNLFQTYVAVSTAKGIELLTLDRKQTMSVPRDLTMAATANIAARIRDQRPLGMFRLNDSEFLLAYEDCAVYADKHGEVSRTLIMEYSGKQKKARAATMYGQYLLLFNEDYVEVRNAENGRLRQIIAGHDVRCLDFGFRGPTGGDNASATAATTTAEVLADGEEAFKGTVKISMTHPEAAGMQIVLELLLNDGHSEKA